MDFGKRLRSHFWRPAIDREVADEFEFHVEMRTRELVAGGMDPARARESAIRRFGDISRVNRTCRDIGRRRNNEMRRREYLSELTQDVRFAGRQLIRSPGFTAAAVITLALGMGATTAIFSAVHAVVLRPLPVRDPERILAIYETWRELDRGAVSAGNFVDGVEDVPSFSPVTAIQYSSFNVGDSHDSERVIGARTTAGFFDVFASRPLHGRVYEPAEDQPGREQVVVLSHRLWTRRFAGDPGVVGRELRLSGRPYQVIGIMPASFDFTAQTEELWVPIAFTPERKAMHDEHYLQVYGRLRDGATAEQAEAELNRNAETLRAKFPRDNADRGFRVLPMMTELVGDYRQRLLVLLGAVGLVLLIACGNVANLLLARGAARAGEFGLRTTLGAGRARIVRQLLTESVVLAGVASLAGLALAWWGIRALVAVAPQGVPRLEQTSLDIAVLAFAMVAAAGSAVLFGLAPALRAARTDVQSVLKEGGRGATMGGVRDRLRNGLIIAELAVTLLLLVGAGLLIRSSLALHAVDPGFEPRGVLSARIALPSAEYAQADHVVRTFERIVEAAEGIAGVEAAAITSQVPMGPGGNSNGLVPEGRPMDPSSAIDSRLRIVTPRYFEAMGVPIVKGRVFTSADRAGAEKVMIISEALARTAFPDGDPIGKRIACCEAGPDGKSPGFKVVVGVAGDVYSRGPAAGIYPEFYLPAAQAPAASWDWTQRTMYVVARTTMDPGSIAAPLGRAIAGIAPGIPLFNVRPMDERLVDTLATARFNSLLLTLLGGIGLILAVVGIYGVLAYFVSRQAQAIGVRMALGATRRDVLALILKQAAWPVGLGIAAGVVIAAAATDVLSNQLFSVTATDPVTFAGVAVSLAAIAVVASLVPAMRIKEPGSVLRNS